MLADWGGLSRRMPTQVLPRRAAWYPFVVGAALIVTGVVVGLYSPRTRLSYREPNGSSVRDEVTRGPTCTPRGLRCVSRMSDTSAYVAAVLIAVWYLAHVVPTKRVLATFEPIE